MCGYALPGMADIIISCQLTPPADCSSRIDEHLVRCAVRELRFEHPTIAATFAWPALEPSALPKPEDGRLVYEVPASEDDVERWLSEVVLSRADAAEAAPGDVGTAVQLVSRDLGRAASGPQATLFEVHFVPGLRGSRCGLVFRLGHALFDGIGSFHFLEMFNAKIAGLLGSLERRDFEWGAEVVRLTGAIPDRARVPWSTERAEGDTAMLDKVREALTVPKTLQGLTIPRPIGQPSTTGVLLRIIPPESLVRLCAAARERGCTIFNVLVSAMLLALLRLHPPESTHAVDAPIPSSAVDLRVKNFRAGVDPRGVGSAIGLHAYVARDLGRFVHVHSGLGGEAAEGRLLEDLWTLGREIRGQVNEQQRYMDRVGVWGEEAMEILGHFTAGVKARDLPPEERLGKLSPLPNVSSIGIVDGHLSPAHALPGGAGVLAVSAPRFSSRIPYNPSMLVHAYTWQGVLYLPFSFAEGYLGSVEEQRRRRAGGGDAPVLAFVEEFMRVLHLAAGDGGVRSGSGNAVLGGRFGRLWQRVSGWWDSPLEADRSRRGRSKLGQRSFRLGWNAKVV